MVTAADIRAAVQVTRRRGYALNPGVPFPNSWGLGVALRYPDGRLAGALSVAAIDSRMQEPRQSELSRLLREEAACVEAKLERAFDRDPPKGRAGHRANGHPTPRLNQPRRISL
jgi:DNA-binding IclR family transcriptional regulator